MSVVFEIETEAPVPLSICPRCGRQVRLDGHCECEAVFLAVDYKKPESKQRAGLDLW